MDTTLVGRFRCGHLAGDEVLRQVAQVVLGTIRVGDSAYRYGGEFSILLSEENATTARAERIRQAIKQLEISVDGRDKIAVKASIGTAVYPDQAQASRELVATADSALYAAKHAGRNRVSEARSKCDTH